MGVKVIILTNAAGALSEDYAVGDLMLIQDHVNFAGFGGLNPFFGAHDPGIIEFE